MGTPRLSYLSARTALALPVLVALSACATATAGQSGALGGAARPEVSNAEVERGPRVQIWTSEDNASGTRIRPSFRLDEDAYVIVVNVDLDGYANVIFPESPEDDGFMRGGRTYRLPSFFPGFATQFRAASYRRAYNTIAAYDDIYDRYAGYVFIIASWRPMHFQLTEAHGLWDNYRLAAHERQLEPYQVMHAFAERLIGSGSRDYTARFARYSAFRGGFANRPYSAFCSFYSFYLPIGGYIPALALHGSNWRLPTFGYYGGGPACGFPHYGYVATRPFRGTIARPVRPPVRPPSSTPGTPGPVTRPPRGEDEQPATRPGEDGKRGRTKSRTRERAAEAEQETIVDVTREARETERARARRSATWRGYDFTPGRTQSERADALHDRAGRRDPVGDRSRSRRESSGGGERRAGPPRSSEPRSSEPRSTASPRSEPARSEPARSEPARSEPARSQPAPSRSEPRSERPSRPSEPPR